MNGDVHIATSGWSYADWEGPFYPDGTPARDYLGFYAETFDVVEVDSTYYRTPGGTMVRGWAERTAEHFRFALNAPGEITHKKMLHGADGDMDEFLAALEPLGDKTLCVLLQFGYFNRKTFSSAKPFFDRLDAFLGSYARRVPLACEIRNKNWLTRDYFDLLRRHSVAATLRRIAERVPVYTFANNHYAGHAPDTCRQLRGAVEERW